MIISIASLKGGTGKSTVLVNLALAFASLKKKVLIFDSDFGANNVDLYLNVDIKNDIRAYLSGDKEFKELIARKNEYIDVISGNSGTMETANMTNTKIEVILEELMTIKDDYDVVLIDTAPTLHNSTMMFCQKSDKVVAVVTPEFPAMMDVYQLLKILINGGFNSKNLYVLVNRVQNLNSTSITFDSINSAAKRYLKTEVSFLGGLENSRAFEKSLRNKNQIYNENFGFRRAFDKFALQLLKGGLNG